MGTTVLDEVTEVMYWVQFPQSARTDVNWSDHQQVHRAVMEMFPAILPGEANDRRARSDILYRVDNLNQEPVVMVQSRIAPVVLPPGGLTRTVPVKMSVQAGDQVAFKLAVNPVRRTTFHLEGRPKARINTVVVEPNAVPAWLADRIGSALSGAVVHAHYRDITRAGRHRIVIDTIEGTATVGDPSMLNLLRMTGVGREKAYGCGLLTVIRIG